MASPANVSDIAARWRPLTSAETTVAQTRLEDAWRKLKRDLPDLEGRMVGTGDLTADVIRVLADSVIRLLQNGARNGLRKGSASIDDGTASWELDSAIRSDLYFTDEELGDLSVGGRRRRARAFSVMPS